MDMDQSVGNTPDQRFRFGLTPFRQAWETDILCSALNTVEGWPNRAYYPL